MRAVSTRSQPSLFLLSVVGPRRCTQSSFEGVQELVHRKTGPRNAAAQRAALHLRRTPAALPRRSLPAPALQALLDPLPMCGFCRLLGLALANPAGDGRA